MSAFEWVDAPVGRMLMMPTQVGYTRPLDDGRVAWHVRDATLRLASHGVAASQREAEICVEREMVK